MKKIKLFFIVFLVCGCNSIRGMEKGSKLFLLVVKFQELKKKCDIFSKRISSLQKQREFEKLKTECKAYFKLANQRKKVVSEIIDVALEEQQILSYNMNLTSFSFGALGGKLSELQGKKNNKGK